MKQVWEFCVTMWHEEQFEHIWIRLLDSCGGCSLFELIALTTQQIYLFSMFTPIANLFTITMDDGFVNTLYDTLMPRKKQLDLGVSIDLEV